MKWEAAIHNLEWDYTHWGPEKYGFKVLCSFALPSISPSVCEFFVEAVKIDVWNHFDGLVQDCSNSSALAMELLLSCTKPSIS